MGRLAAPGRAFGCAGAPLAFARCCAPGASSRETRSACAVEVVTVASNAAVGVRAPASRRVPAPAPERPSRRVNARRARFGRAPWKLPAKRCCSASQSRSCTYSLAIASCIAELIALLQSCRSRPPMRAGSRRPGMGDQLLRRADCSVPRRRAARRGTSCATAAARSRSLRGRDVLVELKQVRRVVLVLERLQARELLRAVGGLHALLPLG